VISFRRKFALRCLLTGKAPQSSSCHVAIRRDPRRRVETTLSGSRAFVTSRPLGSRSLIADICASDAGGSGLLVLPARVSLSILELHWNKHIPLYAPSAGTVDWINRGTKCSRVAGAQQRISRMSAKVSWSWRRNHHRYRARRGPVACARRERSCVVAGDDCLELGKRRLRRVKQFGSEAGSSIAERRKEGDAEPCARQTVRAVWNDWTVSRDNAGHEGRVGTITARRPRRS